MSKKPKTTEAHHEELVKGLYDQMKIIFEKSEQPMYLYLDDNHKACNGKFATFLGYKSPQEWADVKESLDPFVADKSKEIVSSAYWDAINKMIGSTVKVTWKKKDGGSINSTVILVPMVYNGHLFAIHFVTSASQ